MSFEMTNKNILIKPDLTTHVTRLKNFWCSRRITKKFWFYNWLLLLIGNRKVEKKIGLCYIAKSDLERWILRIFYTNCIFQTCQELMMQKLADRWAAQLFNKEKLHEVCNPAHSPKSCTPSNTNVQTGWIHPWINFLWLKNDLAFSSMKRMISYASKTKMRQCYLVDRHECWVSIVAER